MGAKFSYALVVCARWESECISEWLCYYRHIGFDHVYLYCNDDDPAELYEAVLPFTQGPEPFVDFMHFGLQGYQREMYFHFLKNFVDNCEWFAFFDVDEFLLLRHHDTIGDFIVSFAAPPDAIYFNWLPAGHCGHVSRPKGAVLPRYTRCAEHISPFTKVLVRTAALSDAMIKEAGAVGAAFWHNIDALMAQHASIVNVLGQDVRHWYDDFPGRALDHISQADFGRAVLDRAVLYHISFKSEDDFIRRYRRGTSGQFYGQADWRDLSQRGREAVLEHLATLNAREERRLSEVWQTIMQGSLARQIIAPPPGTNLAPGGTALQSSVSDWSASQQPAEDAAGVINGKPCGMFQHHTDVEFEPWWQVDLGEPKTVREIRIFNRIDAVRDRLRNFVVKGSGDGEEWFTLLEKRDDQPFGGVDGDAFIWRPTGDGGHGCVTRYIRVCGVGVSLLDLDQVQVY